MGLACPLYIHHSRAYDGTKDCPIPVYLGQSSPLCLYRSALLQKCFLLLFPGKQPTCTEPVDRQRKDTGIEIERWKRVAVVRFGGVAGSRSAGSENQHNTGQYIDADHVRQYLYNG